MSEMEPIVQRSLHSRSHRLKLYPNAAKGSAESYKVSKRT